MRLEASDIHVEPREDRVSIRYRIDEVLVEKKSLPRDLQNLVTNRIKILADLDISEKRFPQGGRCSLTVLMREIDLRVSTFPSISGKKVVLRILDRAVARIDVESLGMEEETRAQFLELANRSEGIILVGEMRDRETVQVAIQAALTGHLVLSTLHTNSAASALPRLIDMGTEPYLLSASILGILSQRLLRRICPHCKTVDTPSPELIKAAFAGHDMSGTTFYKGAGCSQCRNGFKGRIGTFELLPVSESIRSKIIGQANAGAIKARAIEEGMVTFRDEALGKAIRGVTTLEEVMRITYAEF